MTRSFVQVLGMRRRRSARWHAGLTVALAGAIALGSACTSSSSDTHQPTSVPGSLSGSGTTSADGVERAIATLTAGKKRPDALEGLVPVGKPVPSGKKLAYISCGSPTCSYMGKEAQTIAETLGWTITVVNTDGSAQQVQAGWDQVLREKPDGILYTATPAATIARHLKQAGAAGIPVAAGGVTDSPENGLSFRTPPLEEYDQYGLLQAAWVISTSEGQGSTVFLNLADLPVIAAIKEGFDKAFDGFCPSCFRGSLDIPLAAIGKDAPDLVVSYLRSHPDVKYVVAGADSLLIGVPAALKAAGLSGIQLFGETPGEINLQYIDTGAQAGTVGNTSFEQLYAQFDYIVRHVAGAELPEPQRIPLWVVDKTNKPDTMKIFPSITGLAALYAAAWGSPAANIG